MAEETKVKICSDISEVKEEDKETEVKEEKPVKKRGRKRKE